MKARNPSTGNLETIYVKALDSLPVGAEIDIDDNSEIPVGWEQTEELNTYSTTEKRIGTWIDGKPLYRKVISHTGYVSVITSSMEAVIKNVVDVRGMIKRGDYPNIYLHIPSRAVESQYMSDFGNIQYSSADNSINITLNIGSGVQTMIGSTGIITIIIEYTKTTD